MDAIDNKVLIVQIDKVEKHPNADRLDLVQVRGWHCVTQKGTFKAGDLAVYLPIDSVLPPDLEKSIFPVVVKPVTEGGCWIGRKLLRSINPEYLLISESDNH